MTALYFLVAALYAHKLSKDEYDHWFWRWLDVFAAISLAISGFIEMANHG